jgi:Resolvase, N terminal domain
MSPSGRKANHCQAGPLGRNVAFISNLMESKFEFEAVGFPLANRLTIHIMAAIAEHEAKMISGRTRAALAAAKARGKKAWRISRSCWHCGRLRQSQTSQIACGGRSSGRSRGSYQGSLSRRCKLAAFNREGIERTRNFRATRWEMVSSQSALCDFENTGVAVRT